MPPGCVAAASTSPRRAPWPTHACPARSPRWCIAVADLFVQVVFDLDVPRMAFGRSCLLGDAAFVVRPHAAAGTAKAADDAWTLRDALAAHPDDPAAALAAWEPGQLALGRSLQARTRAIGQRSQVDGNVAARVIPN